MSGGMVLIGFLAIAGFFLVTEHTAHRLGELPYLLLAGCLLMHLFSVKGERQPCNGALTFP